VDLAADWLEFVDFTLTIRANTAAFLPLTELFF